MKVNNIGKMPDNYDRYFSIAVLDEYDFKNLPQGLDEIWYWYAIGSYEGAGELLMRKGDLYDTRSLGHCSCYGPLDGATFNGKPLHSVKSHMSAEYAKEYVDIFASLTPNTPTNE